MSNKYKNLFIEKNKLKTIKQDYSLFNKYIIYVSTHGLGEHYFYLILDKKPKYYKTKEFIVYV